MELILLFITIALIAFTLGGKSKLKEIQEKDKALNKLYLGVNNQLQLTNALVNYEERKNNEN